MIKIVVSSITAFGLFALPHLSYGADIQLMKNNAREALKKMKQIRVDIAGKYKVASVTIDGSIKSQNPTLSTTVYMAPVSVRWIEQDLATGAINDSMDSGSAPNQISFGPSGSSISLPKIAPPSIHAPYIWAGIKGEIKVEAETDTKLVCSITDSASTAVVEFDKSNPEAMAAGASTKFVYYKNGRLAMETACRNFVKAPDELLLAGTFSNVTMNGPSMPGLSTEWDETRYSVPTLADEQRFQQLRAEGPGSKTFPITVRRK